MPTKAMLPVNVRHVNSHIPCESCSLKRTRYEATLNPPGSERVSFRLCERCIEAIRR